MNLLDRKHEDARRMLDLPHPPVPPGLAVVAAAQGRRLIVRRRVVRAVATVLVLAAVAAFTAWAATAQPWLAPPSGVTFGGEGW